MVSSKFRNKILDREKYYSDKEINYIHVFQKKLIMKNMACPKTTSPYTDVTSKITRYRGSASAITILSSAEVVRQVNTDARLSTHVRTVFKTRKKKAMMWQTK